VTDTDVTELVDRYGFARARDLVETKRAGERVSLDATRKADWLKEVRHAFELLDDAYARSILAPEPSNRDELEAWLIEKRLQESGSRAGD